MTLPNSAPTEGLGCLHLFFKANSQATAADFASVVDKFTSKDDCQSVTATILGHKADLSVMALARDLNELRELQSDLAKIGLDPVDSYVSITEVSEYAAGVPDEMKQARLYPNLPPEGMNSYCFYPMSKRRNPGQNWYETDFETRKELMMGHGKSGKEFRGRIVQLITGSTGLDEYEWGVTLFGKHPNDVKDAVYTMRFDEASAKYAEFGDFFVGTVGSAADVAVVAGMAE